MDSTTQHVIEYVKKLAHGHLHPRTVILFGSRASGKARTTSDIDLAFDFDPKQNPHAWSRFCLEVQENAPTLLSIDLINMNEISDALLKKIHDEGIIVYQQE